MSSVSDPENPQAKGWQRSLARWAYLIAALAAMLFGLKTMTDNLMPPGGINREFFEGMLWSIVGLHFWFHRERIPRQ
jgi:hypothetical protein